MKVQAVNISESARPSVRIELFRDRNGNWFASVEERHDGGISVRCTATYTTLAEACADALQETKVQ